MDFFSTCIFFPWSPHQVVYIIGSGKKNKQASRPGWRIQSHGINIDVNVAVRIDCTGPSNQIYAAKIRAQELWPLLPVLLGHLGQVRSFAATLLCLSHGQHLLA